MGVGQLTLRRPGLTEALDAIAFGAAETFGEPAPGAQLRLAYRLDVNEWNGRRRLQLLVLHLEPADG